MGAGGIGTRGIFLSLLLLSETSRMQSGEKEVRCAETHVLLGFEKLVFRSSLCDSGVFSICQNQQRRKG